MVSCVHYAALANAVSAFAMLLLFWHVVASFHVVKRIRCFLAVSPLAVIEKFCCPMATPQNLGDYGADKFYIGFSEFPHLMLREYNRDNGLGLLMLTEWSSKIL